MGLEFEDRFIIFKRTVYSREGYHHFDTKSRGLGTSRDQGPFSISYRELGKSLGFVFDPK